MANNINALVLSLGAFAFSFSAFAHNERSHNHAHGHSHGAPMTETEQKASQGVFSDADVKDRPLTDWEGMWQSVYPIMLSGEM